MNREEPAIPSPCGTCGEFPEDQQKAAGAGTAISRVLRIALRVLDAVAAAFVIAVCVAVLITIHRDHYAQRAYVPAIFTPSAVFTPSPAPSPIARPAP